MIRTIKVLFLALAMSVLAVGVQAADEKKAKAEDVKLTGKITCAKCDLGTAAKCETVIVVKEKDKEVVYSFDKAAHGKYHGDTCKAAKEGTVTGTTKKDGEKMIVTVKSLEYKK